MTSFKFNVSTTKLCKVSIPAGTNLREDVNNLSLPDKDPLQPVWKLSDVFSDQPDGKYLHIVVRSSLGEYKLHFERRLNNALVDRSVHSVCGVTKAREEWTKNFPSRAPSEMGKTKQFASHQRKVIPPFYFNRPPSTAATIPITLYEPIFAQFQDDCETYMPTQEDHAFVLKHTLSMSNFYDTEKARAEQSRADMATYGLDFLATEIRNYCTNGDLRCGEFCYSLLEYKGEIGLTGAEPLFQAGGYYAAFTRDYCKANWFSHLPCFILYAFGEFLGMQAVVVVLIIIHRCPHWLCRRYLDRSPTSASTFSYLATLLPCNRHRNAGKGRTLFWRRQKGHSCPQGLLRKCPSHYTSFRAHQHTKPDVPKSDTIHLT